MTDTRQRSDRPRPGFRRLFHLLFRHPLRLESETCLFILVNVLDYLATFCLLYYGNGQERNPIARWFLEGWGVIKGLLFYKLSLVVFVCVISQIVAAYQPHTARRFLLGASAVIFAVVIYSVWLLVNHT